MYISIARRTSAFDLHMIIGGGFILDGLVLKQDMGDG